MAQKAVSLECVPHPFCGRQFLQGKRTEQAGTAEKSERVTLSLCVRHELEHQKSGHAGKRDR